MEIAVRSDAVDLWEAWIDLGGAGENYTLYVIGDICTGNSKTVPLLLKKTIQGAAASHLIFAELRHLLPLTWNKNFT